MIVQQLRKSGNSYVVTVPKEVVERHGWSEGQMLAIGLTEMEMTPRLPADLEAIVDERWEHNLPALRYLADR